MVKSRDLLIHTSDIIVDVLKPVKGEICFSLNQFMPCFGQYVYLFFKDVLENNFDVEERHTKGKAACVYTSINDTKKVFRYNSQPLGKEYIIRQPIDVWRHCINVITLFSTFKGELETLINGEVFKREFINFEGQIGGR